MQKADVATDITTIKNDYVSNASLTSQLNNLTSQHIATEVTGVDNKTKKNASDILALENKLQQKEDTINENERRLSIFRGFFFYLQQNYLVYEIKVDSFIFDNKKILKWRSTSIFSYSDYYTNVINIYCVYKLDPIASTRDTTFTIQNALFGAMQITKNADNSKNNYKGYGICFDERSQFGHTITEGSFTHTTDARNVLIFGKDMSFSEHATNRANNIYVMGTGLTQGIHDATLYAEKNFYRNLQISVKNLC